MNKEKMVLALKRCIQATFDESKWLELGYLTGSREIIEGNSRLLRSLHFQDDDYGGRILEVLEKVIEADPKNLGIIVEHVDLREWLQDNESRLYEELFGGVETVLKSVSELAVKNSFELNQHLIRIQGGLEKDPELAIGSMKELLESVFKTILDGMKISFSRNDVFHELLKKVQKALKLDPSEVDLNSKGSEHVRKILGSLGQIAIGIDDLRNIYGTGHGRIRHSGITPRHARLVVSSGAALAAFLMETHEYHFK